MTRQKAKILHGRRLGILMDYALYAAVVREADAGSMSVSAMVNILCAEAIAARQTVRELTGKGKGK